MPKKIILFFALALVIIASFVVYLYSSSKNQEATNLKNKTFDNWEESYKIDFTKATGISIFNELLEYKTKKTSIHITNDITPADLKDLNTSYFFIGNQFQLKTEEFDSILIKVNQGANLFLSYKKISSNIHDKFFTDPAFLWFYSEYVDVTIPDKLRINSVFQEDTIAISWNVFSFDKINYDELDNLNDVYSLSEISNYSNFIDFEIGEGHVYLHSNPELFQNYQLLSKNGYAYSTFVLDKIPENHQIKWLEVGRISKDDLENNLSDESKGEKDTSLLQFIFNNKSLTFALLLALVGVTLYLIFRTKRMFHLVPYVPKSTNQSLVFAETIKEIYYKQQTPYSILQVMRKNFYDSVNKKFFIDISKAEKKSELTHLSEKTNIKFGEIETLINNLETKEPTKVDFQYLEKSKLLQQKFYEDSGMIRQKTKDKIETKDLLFSRKILFPLFLILTGIFVILYGFYLLHLAEGLGILSWPIGLFLTGVGIRLYGLPLLKIEAESLVFYYLFAKQKKILKTDIKQVYFEENKTLFITKDDKRITLKHLEISVYEKARYEQFIFPLLNKTL